MEVLRSDNKLIYQSTSGQTLSNETPTWTFFDLFVLFLRTVLEWVYNTLCQHGQAGQVKYHALLAEGNLKAREAHALSYFQGTLQSGKHHTSTAVQANTGDFNGLRVVTPAKSIAAKPNKNSGKKLESAVQCRLWHFKSVIVWAA